MLFAESQQFKMKFGKYKGETLEDIASTDEGLLYLDWARGLDDLWATTQDALDSFLNHPSIAAELQIAIDNKPRRNR
jgi:hypothetical protein